MIDIVSNVIKEMILYFDGDVRRINHALKVYSFSKTIGQLENIPEEMFKILEVAAVLHDIGIKESERKYNSSAGNYQELEGPAVAKSLLEKFNLEDTFVNRVCYLIGHHHTYTEIDNLDYQILIEADFIVNIFEDSIPKDNVDIVKKKYFKTTTGVSLIDSMYK
ncbi:CRISPR/Cas system-associated endonuclease Cas3-HD [Clostridium acetobutylicum]|uniref:HD superfamily hydrolase n=1 Tax=Clostridium acetobutylicum (strain ATCC 824 / DSM 792 / JCM 1419 / IAM 19013 / LMG 5710 / NBRC 13948 / NRRL B-527 / VKM B-1787 / 2291 / W) TaxID=272562 RepID=Q97D78_CLOAB|nr:MULTISPECIES: HD domain-containing protein [Clostridium]AAK81525.1 HD superfamily hydrolase [Clostridium acetobutylicum ATCC 824]ADZ22646.1 HD superfamily hydrolase [Clostridium acetobutylicum EA 2018]AEI32952.1 HD superfamily hydrolase [Clostridium acetobutylicum DSM 1731]AWV80802.1 HD domain-containing protein [Clostridium acetobutylicum]MBC2393873.1 HD domain-containing protein [Clostridium acetobutylicum]